MKIKWNDMASAPMDGTSILLKTTIGITEAWFARGEWSDDTPISPAEYSGDVWVCCDDTWQIEVAVGGGGPNGEDDHGIAVGWCPLPEEK